MLSYKIIKYPSIEFVVTLEIDQTVTIKKSFKHFGTLEQSKCGTFDLVLVHLSKKVMSKSVTEDLDIVSALGLLLKPSGIFVKNDLYLECLNKVFSNM